MTRPTDDELEAVERYEAARRIDRALNTPSSALREIRELKARAETLDAKLKEAGEHIEAVSDAFAKQIGVRRHNAWPIIRAARAFLACLEGDKP